MEHCSTAPLFWGQFFLPSNSSVHSSTAHFLTIFRIFRSYERIPNKFLSKISHITSLKRTNNRVAPYGRASVASLLLLFLTLATKSGMCATSKTLKTKFIKTMKPSIKIFKKYKKLIKIFFGSFATYLSNFIRRERGRSVRGRRIAWKNGWAKEEKVCRKARGCWSKMSHRGDGHTGKRGERVENKEHSRNCCVNASVSFGGGGSLLLTMRARGRNARAYYLLVQLKSIGLKCTRERERHIAHLFSVLFIHIKTHACIHVLHRIGLIACIIHICGFVLSTCILCTCITATAFVSSRCAHSFLYMLGVCARANFTLRFRYLLLTLYIFTSSFSLSISLLCVSPSLCIILILQIFYACVFVPVFYALSLSLAPSFSMRNI